MQIRLFDIQTATTLAQILPLLLIALTVELRRLQVHRRGKIVLTRILIGAFFLLFGIAETILVLSIDGHVYPFAPSDFFAAGVIFALLVLLCTLSLIDDVPRKRHAPDADRIEAGDEGKP